MLTEYDTTDALATFRSGVADPDLFLVHKWTGEEAVSRPYRFEIDLASRADNIDLNGLLGSRATLTIRGTEEQDLPWHGIVTELRQTRRDETYAYYRAVLEPQLALLRLFRLSRVYVHADEQAGGKPDLYTVIRRVLEQCGLTQEGDSSRHASTQYCVRVSAEDMAATRSSFICQFEETSLDFLLRRLEHEGVYFFFEQGPEREVVVFTNHRKGQPSAPTYARWRPDGDLSTELDAVVVSHLDHVVSVQPRGVVLRDFAVSKPALDLTAKAAVSPGVSPATDRFDAFGSVEVYGTHYNKQALGERMAAIRAEEIACQRNRFYAEVRSPGVHSGHVLALSEHFRSELNDDYYVIDVRHEGRQSLPRQTAEQNPEDIFYRANATLLPASVQFRPARLTRKPRVVGFLSAIVVAEGSGEYAEINEHGCYRLRFLFAPSDAHRHDEGNSAWVRMATPYAGAQQGMNFPLLKGTEVLVSFLGGDPDRPVIVSAVPNEENPSIRNQGNATQPGLRTAGQNALEFEDRKGAQHARLTSPAMNTTFHLGADADNPERSGVRMATKGHVGVTGTSYIQQVPGAYHLEIGRKGSVDTDPEPRLHVAAARQQAMAAWLDEQAAMPDAKPAQQRMALKGKRRMNEAWKALLMHRLGRLKLSDGADPDMAMRLRELLARVDEITGKIDDVLNASGDEALKKLFDEWLADKEQADKEAEEEETRKKEEQEKDFNHNAMKALAYYINTFCSKVEESINAMFGVDLVNISNSISFGVSNSISASLSNSIAFSRSHSINYGSVKGVNLNEYGSVKLGDGTEILQKDKNEIVAGSRVTAVRSRDDKAVDVTENYGSQTKHVAGTYQLSANEVIEMVGEGGKVTRFIGPCRMVAATANSQLSFEHTAALVKVMRNGVMVSGDHEIFMQCGLGSTLQMGPHSVLLEGDASVDLISGAKIDLEAEIVSIRGKKLTKIE